jgi:RNA polymerase sigma factor (sigma-70 family)
MGLEELDAADVLNAALYRAIVRIDQLKDPARLRGWLYRLVYRAGVDWHRKARARLEVPLDDEILIDVQPPVETGSDVSVALRAQKVDAVMASLSARDQEVLSAVAHDLSNEELAEVLSVAPGHARVLRHRAIERFRKAYARLFGQASAIGQGELSENQGTER